VFAQHILAIAEIRADLEQHLGRAEGRRQALREQKLAEERRLTRVLDAQLKQACDSCIIHEREIKDLLGEVLGQLHTYTGKLHALVLVHKDHTAYAYLPALFTMIGGPRCGHLCNRLQGLLWSTSRSFSLGFLRPSLACT
jgi:hypothetical protein